MQPAIRVENLGKRYKIGLREAAKQTFREALVGLATAPLRRLRTLGERASDDETIWALRDVSFEVAPGEVVGIIGRNGAGKTTLLKILSRITDPTEGRVELRGRVASLLEVGTGFHPELTGRENIYLNGAILGMKKAEIDRRFDEIVEFSGIEKFLDTPVKRYSSGMYVRLAFSVAAHLEPEILIVDEVLAVGDIPFQRKCLGKMQDVAARRGRTVLFVSHNMDAVLGLCSHVVVMDQGRNTSLRPPEEGVQRYLRSTTGGSADIALREAPRTGADPGPPVLTRLEVRTEARRSNRIGTGGRLTLIIDLDHLDLLASPECGIVITDFRGRRVAAFHTRYQADVDLPHSSSAQLACSIPSLPLVPGRYMIDVTVNDGTRTIDRVERAAEIDVMFVDVFGTGRLPNSQQGCIVLPCRWHVESC